MAYTIEVDENAAVIVFGADDTNKIYIPKMVDDVEVPINVLLATAVALNLQEEEFVDELLDSLPDTPQETGYLN